MMYGHPRRQWLLLLLANRGRKRRRYSPDLDWLQVLLVVGDVILRLIIFYHLIIVCVVVQHH